MEDPGGSLWLYLLILLFLILSNAFFAMSELAVIGLSDAKLQKMAQDGHKKAKILYPLTAEPSKFLSTVQVGVTLSGMLASAVAADTFADLILAHLSFPGIPLALVRGALIVLITIVLSFVTIVFGELVPKRLAMQYPEKIAFAVAGPLRICYLVEKPFVLLLSFCSNQVIRLLGIDPTQDPEEVTEEEIRMMVDVGGEKGIIEESEKEMINNIFEFDDRTVADVMTHRTDVAAVEMDATLDEVISLATQEGYSRIPVYEETLDDIKGILYVKDLLQLTRSCDQKAFHVRNYMRSALFVPESNRCREVFVELKAKKIQMAVVVDEYGGTSGIVTMEDLLETIVGNIQDEYDCEEEEVSLLPDGSYSLDGSVDLEEVERLFKVELDEGTDYGTISGLITDLLGRIPSEDEHPQVSVAGIEFTVLESAERRINRVQAKRIPPASAPVPTPPPKA